MIKIVFDQEAKVRALPVWEGEAPEELEKEFWEYLETNEFFVVLVRIRVGQFVQALATQIGRASCRERV